MLRHLRQKVVKKQWENFKRLIPEEQTMEKGAVIVAQWSQPTEEITDESIGEKVIFGKTIIHIFV